MEENINSCIKVKVLNINYITKIIECIILISNENILVKYGDNKELKYIKDIPKNSQINLINCKKKENIYIPKYIVLEPSYIINVTKISNCFYKEQSSEIFYIINNIFISPINIHLIKGILSNNIMNEISLNFDVKLIDIIKKDFSKNYLKYISCKELNNKCIKQKMYIDIINIYKNIKEYIKKIINKKLIIESSIIIEDLGLQGRLDMVYLDEIKKILNIIELKSSYPRYNNNLKLIISVNYLVQVYIYILMLKYIYFIKNKNIKVDAYIFYPILRNNNLKKFFFNKNEIYNILNIRNKIVLNEIQISKNSYNIVSLLHHQKYLNYFSNTFFNRQYNNILSKSMLELNYFNFFYRFISNEILNHKKIYTNNITYRHNLLIIKNLKIIKIINTNKNESILKLETNDKNYEILNFRVNDRCIIYKSKNISTINDFVIKCKIIELNESQITLITFNNILNIFNLKNENYINENEWFLKEDYYNDNTFKTMYENLSFFIQSQCINKNFILLKKLNNIQKNKIFYKNELSNEQNRVINKIINCNNFFILNGPPGSGKTSIIIKHVVEELYINNNIILIGYTNRSINEICRVLKMSNKINNKYIRISDESSCPNEFRDNLINNLINLNNSDKNHVIELLNTFNIFVSNLYSINNNDELLNIKSIDLAIIDEASQILEPMILRTLLKVKKFILIGDYNQLGTITVQNNSQCLTKNKLLNDIEIRDASKSLFERLFIYCNKNKLLNNYDILTYQGRIHKDISSFVSRNFYDNNLKIAYDDSSLPKYIRNNLKSQINPLKLNHNNLKNDIEKKISNNRMVFFNANNIFQEINLVKNIIQVLTKLYINIDFSKDIGIISPFKKQVSLIKNYILKKNYKYSSITIDTVERFQGTERKIIIYSFGINNVEDLNNCVNLDENKKIDKKLNVVLTRAKEQILIIGNKKIIQKNNIFNKLINYINNIQK